ncbi:MAG TPA: hypothetical protein VIP53_06690 [Nitrososphaera sp.]
MDRARGFSFWQRSPWTYGGGDSPVNNLRRCNSLSSLSSQIITGQINLVAAFVPSIYSSIFLLRSLTPKEPGRCWHGNNDNAKTQAPRMDIE